MKKILLVLTVITLFGLSACNKDKDKPADGKPSANAVHTVKVLDKIDASNYTYLLVSENDANYWIAANRMQVEKGETVQFSRTMEMKNFPSKSLNRTFESIYFVEDCVKEGEIPASGGPHGGMMGSGQSHPQVSTSPEQVSVEPAKGGKTVAQIFAESASLSGKTVKVKGKVVKYNSSIMDRNWIHLQDGTNSNGQFDLMVTSTESTAPGEIVTVEGKVILNKDFGAGYSYPVMIENAKIFK